MKQINITRYTGSNHVSIIADKKNNSEISTTFQATALSPEEAEDQLKNILSENLSEGDNLLTPDSFEFIITDFPQKKFTNLTTEKLLKLYEKTEQMLGAREMIESILTRRGAISVIEPEEDPQENESAESVEEGPKPTREYKKCMTEECLQARLAEARTHYREFAKFLCTKTKTEEVGIVRSARLDKRSGFIQYRIEIISVNEDGTYTKTGRIYGKGDDSKDLTLLPTDTYKPVSVEEPAQAEENTNIEG